MRDRFTVRWTQTSVDDPWSILDDVADRDGTDAAEHLYGQIRRGVAGLEAEGVHGYRELLVGPYRVMFAVRGDEVVLLTVLDGRRDLGELLIARALRERA